MPQTLRLLYIYPPPMSLLPVCCHVIWTSHASMNVSFSSPHSCQRCMEGGSAAPALKGGHAAAVLHEGPKGQWARLVRRYARRTWRARVSSRRKMAVTREPSADVLSVASTASSCSGQQACLALHISDPLQVCNAIQSYHFACRFLKDMHTPVMCWHCCRLWSGPVLPGFVSGLAALPRGPPCSPEAQVPLSH